MVAAEEHFGDVDPAEGGRARVGRMVELGAGPGFVGGGLGIDRTGDHAHRRIEQRHRRDLAAGEHELAEQDLLDGIELPNPLVDAILVWRKLERMAILDRAILRLAMHELRTSDTPPKVVINEAVELAKKFSSEGSGAFVNGILDAFRKTLPANAAAE